MDKTIGDLELGDQPSDGETTCTGCWDCSDHDIHADTYIPSGQPIYWTSPSYEYGECDAYCLKCAKLREALNER